jgi:hypothetical protein
MIKRPEKELSKIAKYALGIGLGAAAGGALGYFEKCRGST